MDEDWMDMADAREVMGTPFVAELRSTCSQDGDVIAPGEMIQRTADGFAHTFCIRNANRPVVWE